MIERDVLRMTYEPESLRFFQARFEPLAPFLERTPARPTNLVRQEQS